MGASSGKSEIWNRDANISYHPPPTEPPLTHSPKRVGVAKKRSEKAVEPQNGCSVFHTRFPINHATVVHSSSYPQQGCTGKGTSLSAQVLKHELGRAKPTVENTGKKGPLLVALSLLVALGDCVPHLLVSLNSTHAFVNIIPLLNSSQTKCVRCAPCKDPNWYKSITG